MMAPANPEHHDLNWWLCTLLRHYVDKKDMGIVLWDTWTRLKKPRDQIRAPDVLFVAKARADIVQMSKPIGGAPDLIMEVISRDSQARDWREKYAEYEAAGVREYWVVDPFVQTVEPYILGPDGKYKPLNEVGGKFISTVVDGWYLWQEWLWQTPRPSVLDLLPELGIKLG
jgi:Uma2 family endonuclease